MAMTQLGIRLNLEGAAAVQGGLSGVSGKLGELDGGVMRVGDAFNRLGGVSASVVGSLKTAFVGIFGVVGAMQLSREFVQMADAMTLLNARLRLATGGGDEFLQSQRAIYQIAQANGGALQETTTLYTKLLEPVKRLGGGVKENTAIVEAFSSALRVGGASTQEAASATLQFAQAMASGKLSGDEFRSLAEASPRFMRALADGMGVPIEALKTMGTEGKLTADVVGNALIKQLGALRDEAREMPDTVGAAFQRMKNDVALMVDEVNTAQGVTKELAELIGVTNAVVLSIAQAFRTWGSSTREASSELDSIGIIAGAAGTVLETLIVLASDVAFVFKGMGREIGGIAAQFSAMGEAGGIFTAEGRRAWVTVGQEVEADAKRAREELDRFQGSVLGATSRVLAQRDALKDHSLSSSENAQEVERLRNRHGAAGEELAKLKAAQAESTAEQKKAIEEARKAAEAADKYIDKINDQVAALQQQLTLGRDLTEAEKEHNKLTDSLREGTLKLTEAQQAEARAKIDLVQQLKDEIAQRKEQEKLYVAVAAHSAKLNNAQIAETEALRKGNIELRDQAEKLGLSEREIVSREAALLRATATDKDWQAANEGGNYQLSEQARLLRERADLLEQGVVVKEAKAAADEWQKTTDSINDGLTDALMRAFESGKGFMSAFRDTLVNAFKTMVLQPTIKAIMAPVSGALGSLFSGKAFAGQGVEGGLGSMLSSGMNFLGGGSINAAASGGVIRLGDWLSTSSNNTLAGIGDFVSGNAGMLGSGLGMLGNGFAGYGISKALSGGYSAGSWVNTVAGIASAIPGIGPIAGVVGGLVNRAFGMKAKEMKDAGITGTITGGDATGNQFQDWFQKGGWFRSNKSGTDLTAMNADLAAALDLGASGVLSQVQAYAAALQLPGEALRSVSSTFRVTLTGEADADQKAIAGILSDYEAALSDRFAAALAPLMKAGETASEALKRLAGLQAFSESINAFGGIFSRIAGSSIAAREHLVGLAGGIEQLMAKAGAFVRDFYTSSEQAGLQARSVSEALTSIGLDGSGLGNRADFRALVESLDVSTEQGRTQLNALLDLAPQFAQLADYLQQQQLTLEEAVAAAPQIAALEALRGEAEDQAAGLDNIGVQIDEGNSILAQIREGVAALQASIEAGLATVASNTASTTRLLDSWDDGGAVATATP